MDQLVQTYHTKGISHKVIAEKIVKVGTGLLHLCSYSDKEMDMATTIFHTGGQRLMFAGSYLFGIMCQVGFASQQQWSLFLEGVGSRYQGIPRNRGGEITE
jgi:hypothetical protein